MFADRLTEKIKEKNNPSVIGLDPVLDRIPQYLKVKSFEEFGLSMQGAAEAIYLFNKALIDVLYDIIPAVKPQIAFYELYGEYGYNALKRTIAYSKEKGLLVICDGKRNDIGNTASAYSDAYLGETRINGSCIRAFDADALTVNPYMGSDSIKPFIDDCIKYGKGIFVLVKTSNKSSGDIQDLITQDGRRIYEVAASHVYQWGRELTGKSGYSSIGSVVGATYPEQGRILRTIMKDSYILVPGYGAQGGSAEDAAVFFNDDGKGAVVNASRSVLYAYLAAEYEGKFNNEGFCEASRLEAIKMRDELNQAIERKG